MYLLYKAEKSSVGPSVCLSDCHADILVVSASIKTLKLVFLLNFSKVKDIL